MDHPEAIRLMAVEKYLLNELSPELRRSFEEHLFECKECEFDVQAGYAFIDGSKEVLASTAVEVPKAVVPGKPNQWLSWFRPAFAAPVMALLVAVVGYQNLVTVPGLKNEVAVAEILRLRVDGACAVNCRETKREEARRDYQDQARFGPHVPSKANVSNACGHSFSIARRLNVAPRSS